MAAQEIGALFVNLAMNTASFESQMKRIAGQVSGFGSKIQSELSSVAGAFRLLQAGMAAFGVMGAIQGFASWTKSMADAGEQADILTKTLGTTLGEIAQLEGMFQLSSGSIDGASTSIIKLNKAFADASTNEGDMRANFQALGISWQQLQATGGNTTKILELLADRLHRYENDANKSAITSKLLGKTMGELQGVIGNGLPAYRALQEEVRRIDPNAEAAKEAGLRLDAALDKLNKSLTALKNDVFIQLEPLITSSANAMALFAQNVRLAIGPVNALLGPLGGIAGVLQKISGLGAFGMLKGAMTGDWRAVLAAATGAAAGQFTPGTADPNKVVADATLPDVEVKDKVTPPPKGGGGGGGGDRVSQWRDELDQMLIAERKFFKDNKNDELAFWQEKVKLTADGSKEQLSVRKIIFELEKQLAIKRRDDLIADAEHESQINDERFNRAKQRISAMLATEQISAQTSIDQEKSLVEQKWVADQEYYARKKAAAEGDTDTLDKLNKQQALDHEKHLTTLEGLNQKKVETMYARLKSLADDFTNVLGNAFSNAFDKISDHTFKLKDAIGGLMKDLGRMIANRAFRALLGGESGESSVGGGLLGKLATRLVGVGLGGGSGLPANFGGPAGDFATNASGGSYRVGGVGAIDSKLVAFRASPGELVDVTPASQRGGAGAEIIRIDLNPSEGWVSGVADQRIVTRSGQIIDLAVRQSQKTVARNFAGMTAETQARQM